jgi:hypothetical protein
MVGNCNDFRDCPNYQNPNLLHYLSSMFAKAALDLVPNVSELLVSAFDGQTQHNKRRQLGLGSRSDGTRTLDVPLRLITLD